MRDTQQAAWIELKVKLTERQRQVVEVITSRGGACTSFKVAEVLNVPINYVSGRFTELNDKGVIVDSGIRSINPLSGKRVIVWTFRKRLFPHPQLQVAYERLKDGEVDTYVTLLADVLGPDHVQDRLALYEAVTGKPGIVSRTGASALAPLVKEWLTENTDAYR